MSKSLLYALPCVCAGLAVSFVIIRERQDSRVSPPEWMREGSNASTQTQPPDAASRLGAPDDTRQVLAVLAGYDGTAIAPQLEPAVTSADGTSGLQSYLGLIRTQKDINQVVESFSATQVVAQDQMAPALSAMSTKLAECGSTTEPGDVYGEHLDTELAKVCSRLAAVEAKAMLRGKVAKLQQSFDAAFAKAEYQEVRSLGNMLLANYGSVLLPTERDHIELQRKRAIFREELANLDRMVHYTLDREGQLALFSNFVQRYAQVEGLTQEMRAALAERKLRLESIQQVMADSKNAASALSRIQNLRGDGQATLASAVREAVAILSACPSPDSTRVVREFCRDSLKRAFPLKEAGLPDGLQECEWRDSGETKTHLISGFMKAVTNSAGDVIGYKVYKTRADLNNPQVQVGTYAAEFMVSKPGPSVPEVCARRYNEAREGFLKALESAQNAEEFANVCNDLTEICGKLTDDMQNYGSKSGALSSELSFSAEVSLLTELVEQRLWEEWRQVFNEANDK